MRYATITLLLLLACPLLAQMSPEYLEEQLSEEELLAAYEAYVDSVEATMTFYADTTMVLGQGLVELTIPEGYRFVGSEDARTVLVDLWGNPPQLGEGTMGMLFPEEYSPVGTEGYGIEISFTEDGYISDEDATDIDYDELLEQMQADVLAANEERRLAGYEAMELVDWATPPRYDATNKRLHWAKELAFEGIAEPTLNYNVLFLGRRGYLTMNVIGGMENLPQVNDKLDEILASVSYQEGHRYSDYQPGTDRVAAYGIGALIAGKVLAKTGFLAMIGVFLLKAWKIILIAGVAIGAGVKSIFKK